MKIILYPTTSLGKLLLKLGLSKPTEINISFDENLEIKCNKPELLGNMVVEFSESFTTKNPLSAKAFRTSYPQPNSPFPCQCDLFPKSGNSDFVCPLPCSKKFQNNNLE